MTVAQEEIFGPVVTVIPFEDEKDAIRLANDVQYGLMATVWTGDPARGHRLARADQGRARSGSTCRTPRSRGSRSAGTSSPASAASSALETLELYLETKSVLVSTSSRPFNPFGL